MRCKRDLSKLRTGRAHAGMLDSVRVDYYGQVTPLAQMATVNVPEPRLITVKPWDKSQVQGGRKGDPRERPRAEPAGRRRAHPHPDSAL